MRKPFSYLTAGIVLFLMMLTLFTPVATRRVRAADLQEKCDECTIRNNRQFEQCLAVHGQDHIRCYEQYNEGVVICFRNFCEQ